MTANRGIEAPILELGIQRDSRDSNDGFSPVVAAKANYLKRIEVQDRRRAAIHEAGHHVMACHRGKQEVDSWIERAGDPTLSNKAWIGRCVWENPSPGLSQQDVMIGVAGMIAEQLWLAGNDPDRMDCMEDLMDDPNCMSDSDRYTVGLAPGAGFREELRPQIEAAIDLLRGPLRSELIQQARRMIIESRDIYT